MRDKHAGTLIGWKETASHLACSLSSARRREQEGFPVFRVGGSVRAFADGIDSRIRKGRGRRRGARPAAVEPVTARATDKPLAFSGFTVERHGRRFVVVSLSVSSGELERAAGRRELSEEKYLELLENVPVWTWETDASGSINIPTPK